MRIIDLPYNDTIVTIVEKNVKQITFKSRQGLHTINTPKKFRGYQVGDMFRIIKCVRSQSVDKPMPNDYSLFEWQIDGDYRTIKNKYIKVS